MGIFKKSTTSTQAYLKMGLFGFAGSGKTRTATEVAVGLIRLLRQRQLKEGGRPVYFLDTETGSDYVEPRFKAEKIEIRPAKTRAFSDLIPAVDEAEKEAGVLIIDSITHFWREFTEAYAKKMNRKRGLEFADWAYLKREWGKFTDRYVNSACHIVLCGRAGFEFDFFVDDAGKKQLEKTGIKMKAETETGYEPSLLVLMEREMDVETKVVVRTAYVLKDRFGLIDGKAFKNPTFADFKQHVEALNLGGEQLGVDVSRTSEGMIESPDNSFKHRQQQIEITLDEIQSLLVKYHPGQSAADKKAKGDLMEAHLRSRSWERIKTYSLVELRAGYNQIMKALEGVSLEDFAEMDKQAVAAGVEGEDGNPF